MVKKILKKDTLFYLLLLIPLYYLLYQIFIPRAASFGCFDDCFNYTGGFFILKGLKPYADFFFNHQIIMPYLSALVQSITDPINIYDLLLKHRQFLILFSLLFNVLLILRFRLSGFLFVIFYEFSKFYLFGDRFLAEAFIVYPIAYMAGLMIYKFHGREVHKIEYFLTAVFTWFVIFMREPFTLLALALFTFIHIPTPKKTAILSFLILLSLSLLTIISHSPKEYFWNVFSVNKEMILTSELRDASLLKVFLYPLYIFISGEWNIFRNYLVLITLCFLVAIFYYSAKVRNFKLLISLFIVLGLANIRFVEPGKIFYASFHLIPWFGMLIMSTFVVLSFIKRKSISYVLYLFLFLSFIIFITSDKSYLRDKVDPHELLLTNYQKEISVGDTIKSLSSEGDTYFADGYLEITIWNTGLLSPYKYGWYTSFMPKFERYKDARQEMFENNPPDFYYGSCEEGFPILPELVVGDYSRLEVDGKPSCIFVHKSKLAEISDDQLKKAQEGSYSLP